MRAALVIFIVLQLAFASSIMADATLNPAGSTKLIVSAEYPGLEGKTVYLNVSGAPGSVVVKDKTGLIIDHEEKSFGNYTLIYATVPLDYLQFEIVSDSFTAKEGSSWNYSLIMGSSENLTSFDGSLTLPRGTILKTTNGEVSNSADALLVTWHASNVDNMHNVRLRAGYELQEVRDDASLLFGLAGIALMLIILYYLKTQPQEAQPMETLPPEAAGLLESSKVFKTLDEVDKEIVLEIYRSKGKTTQATIYLNTHIPKATLSRRLASLEGRGIIQKSQKGNRNLITLTDLLKNQ
jgi:uncharacterized membrane protein